MFRPEASSDISGRWAALAKASPGFILAAEKPANSIPNGDVCVVWTSALCVRDCGVGAAGLLVGKGRERGFYFPETTEPVAVCGPGWKGGGKNHRPGVHGPHL